MFFEKINYLDINFSKWKKFNKYLDLCRTKHTILPKVLSLIIILIEGYNKNKTTIYKDVSCIDEKKRKLK